MKSPQFKAWVFCILLLGFGLGATRTAAVFAQGAQLQDITPGSAPPDLKIVTITGSGPVIQGLTEIPEDAQFYFSPNAEEEISQALSGDYEVRVLTSDHSKSRREVSVVLEIWSSEGGRRYGYRASESGVVPFGFARLDSSLLGTAVWAGMKWFLLALLLLPVGLLPGRFGRSKY